MIVTEQATSPSAVQNSRRMTGEELRNLLGRSLPRLGISMPPVGVCEEFATWIMPGPVGQMSGRR